MRWTRVYPKASVLRSHCPRMCRSGAHSLRIGRHFWKSRTLWWLHWRFDWSETSHRNRFHCRRTLWSPCRSRGPHTAFWSRMWLEIESWISWTNSIEHKMFYLFNWITIIELPELWLWAHRIWFTQSRANSDTNWLMSFIITQWEQLSDSDSESVVLISISLFSRRFYIIWFGNQFKASIHTSKITFLFGFIYFLHISSQLLFR